ncbi:MAG: CDP-diacylglycerol--glycerol-3-phosphate 3-phosphatidyltransferase [bacterium]
MFTLPMEFTLFRLLLAIAFVGLFYWNSIYSAYGVFLIFIAAIVSDVLDGYFARRGNQVTDLGKLLDPLMDKIIVISALILFVENGIVHSWIAIIIASRELAVSILRSILATKGVVLAADSWGKLKNASQMGAVLLILAMRCLRFTMEALGTWQSQYDSVVFLVSNVSMGSIAGITILSGINYFWWGRRYLTAKGA